MSPIEYPTFEQMNKALYTFATQGTDNEDLQGVILDICERNEAIITKGESHPYRKTPMYAIILTRRLWRRYCYLGGR